MPIAGSRTWRLFEVGQVFRGDTPQDQLTAAAGVRRALAKASGIGRHWSGSGEVGALRCQRRCARGAGGRRDLACRRCRSCRAGRPGCIRGAGHDPARPAERARLFRRAASAHARSAQGRRAAAAFELILDSIPAPKPRPTRAKPPLDLPSLQPVERDFAFVVDRGVKAADIVRAAQSADRKLISGVTVFDVYEGKGIEAGKKSIAIAVTLQPREKTMTDAEIEAIAGKIVAEVIKRTGGTLRG